MRARPVSCHQMRLTMSRRDAVAATDLLDLLLHAMSGVFPGPVIEALIARMEAGK